MRNSLTISKDEVDALIASGHQYVVRFKVEPNEEVLVHDLIRGTVSFNSSILDDKVLYKSADDLPTYHLANIVDDHLRLLMLYEEKNGSLVHHCMFCCIELLAGRILCHSSHICHYF